MKNLGNISDRKNVVTKEYVDDNTFSGNFEDLKNTPPFVSYGELIGTDEKGLIDADSVNGIKFSIHNGGLRVSYDDGI